MIDLAKPQRIHVVGVGGSGMSAIATVMRAMGHSVSGSDLRNSHNVERLIAQGVTVRIGHDASSVHGVDAVAVSTAIARSNVEVAEAERLGIPVLRRADVLSAICERRAAVAVAGTHGKTTTASMLSLIAVDAGWHPSFIIGGEVNEIGGGAVWDEGEWLVVEADESDGTFLELPRRAAIVTSVEPDHIEFYGGVEQMEAAFDRFVEETPGPVIVDADGTVAAAMAARHGAVTTGLSPSVDYAICEVEGRRADVSFTLRHAGTELGRIRVPVPGLHNARNAASSAALALEIGVPFDAVTKALGRFAGVARRFQFRGRIRDVDFVEDFAHLPTEVAVAVATARDGGWERIVVVFQPHRFSRTQANHAEFATAFEGADHVIVTDIYGSGEPPRPGITGELVADAVRRGTPDLGVTWLPGRGNLAGHLAGALRPGDLCLLLSAGDLTSVPDEVAAVP
ncbi:MAG TPA: UDP-N-acetylmuramate--L-alanine ligase [Acidimicrobiales bacterium]|nr:UDP-N-acetylmuramate--L-alanine ligase [Acidimicrobiales bacterium]